MIPSPSYHANDLDMACADQDGRQQYQLCGIPDPRLQTCRGASQPSSYPWATFQLSAFHREGCQHRHRSVLRVTALVGAISDPFLEGYHLHRLTMLVPLSPLPSYALDALNLHAHLRFRRLCLGLAALVRPIAGQFLEA